MAAGSVSTPPPGFWDAAFQGDLTSLREHVQRDVDVNAWPPGWKSAYQPTALAYAVWGNQPAVVKLLLQSGADPNRPDGDGNYHPLHWASYKSDHAECAQLLVDAGADISVTTKRGFTPLEIARGQNNVVSSKPGVAAVLERAQAQPRAPWSSSERRSRSNSADGEPNGRSAGAGGDGVHRSNTAPEREPAATPSVPNLRAPGRLGQTWSPLASAQAAAAAEAATAFAARQRVALVRDERAAMERAVLNAQRDALRRQAEEQEKADVERREAAEEAAKQKEAELAQERRDRSRRALVARGAIATVLALLALQLAASSHALGGALLGLAVALLFLPEECCEWLPSWRAVARGGRALASREQPWPAQFLCPITGELMEDPVTTADGHTFERVAIERWLQAHDTSPMTGATLSHTQLAPAIALRQLITDSKARSS